MKRMCFWCLNIRPVRGQIIISRKRVINLCEECADNPAETPRTIGMIFDRINCAIE